MGADKRLQDPLQYFGEDVPKWAVALMQSQYSQEEAQCRTEQDLNELKQVVDELPCPEHTTLLGQDDVEIRELRRRVGKVEEKQDQIVGSLSGAIYRTAREHPVAVKGGGGLIGILISLYLALKSLGVIP